MSNRVVAVIPVKDKSERVKSKNFIEFLDGKSLFELKIEQLKNSGVFDEIYVSSNSDRAKAVCDKEDIKYTHREDRFCNNDIPWSDVIFEVVNSLPEEEETSVAWCHTTSPLFSNFEDAIQKYKSLGEEYNGLVTVKRFTEFLVNAKGFPVNYNWGVWHKYSQYLDIYFTITGALFVAPIKEMKKNRYVISTNPYLYETSDFEAIDVDTEFDFKLAQMMLKNLKD